VPGITDLQIAMANWHVVSFNRFAAGYHLAVHGYYFDAIALGRDLWEVSLSLAGLKKGIVTLQELIAANATNASEMESMSRKADRTIRDKLLKANTALSGAAKEAIDAFIYITNAAVHKSKLHTSLNLRNWASGNPIPIFPHFDLEQASAAYNVFFQASWGLFSTLPYLDFALPGSNRTWQERYERVQLAFVEGLGRGPKPYHQAWPTVIRAVF